MNICIFAGARPNFIKIAPIIRAIQALSPSRGVESTLVYAGRADDPTLESSLFDDLQIAPPDVFLGVECENLNELTGQVMSQFERYLSQHPTDAVVVVDDLASTMAAAIVTKKQGLLLAHIAAEDVGITVRREQEHGRGLDGSHDVLSSGRQRLSDQCQYRQNAADAAHDKHYIQLMRSQKIHSGTPSRQSSILRQ